MFILCFKLFNESTPRRRRCTFNSDISRSDLTSLESEPSPAFRSPASALTLGIRTPSEIKNELRGYVQENLIENKYYVSKIDDSKLRTFKRELCVEEPITEESCGVLVALVKPAKSKKRKTKYPKYSRLGAKARQYSKRSALRKIFRSSVRNFVFYTVPASSIIDHTKPCLSSYCIHRDHITIGYHKETQTPHDFFVVQPSIVKATQTESISSKELKQRRELEQQEIERITDAGNLSRTHAGSFTAIARQKRILQSARDKFCELKPKVSFWNDKKEPLPPASYDHQLYNLRRPINIIRNVLDTSTLDAITDEPVPAESGAFKITLNPLDIHVRDFQVYDQPAPPTINHYVPNKYIPKVKPTDHNHRLFWNRNQEKKIYPELDSPIEKIVEEVPANDDYRYCYFVGKYRFPRAFTLPSSEHPSDTDVDEEGVIYCTPQSSPTRKPMGTMGSQEDHERKVIIEFCHLLEKAKQLFNGLRELPQYGHKQWHSYFGRTFDVYTKLWKFQQQHRFILDNKYGLKRWQIGEIASKIGQLYYHFYLRTSETAYLNEAYAFYYAIRGRSYYTKAFKEEKCELMVKKLRYYARFIVVCLLLKKVMLVRDLIKELDRQIVEYGNSYDPDDQIEWTVVVNEVKAFIQSEPVVSVIHPENYPMVLSHRLSPLNTPPVERIPQMNLTLQEVIIIGSNNQQVKFSELTLDMFRMLQILEREPRREIQHMYDDSPRQKFNITPSAINNIGYNLESELSLSDNPHKYLLYKPPPSQILVYLATACNDMPPNSALLLYISADGHTIQSSKHPDEMGYDAGGLITTSKIEVGRESSKDQKERMIKEQQVFHPGDMFPFTRRPLFIIIESNHSFIFQNIPRHFGQPMVILMSPLETPTTLNATSDRKHQGSLFTLFLHSPLTAFCYCCDIHDISMAHWDRAQSYVDTFLTEASQIVCRRIDAVYLSFMGDDFLRLLILRYIFCETVLRMHRGFRIRNQLSRCSPPIPDDLFDHHTFTHIVMDLATHLQVRCNFHERHEPAAAAAAPPPVKEYNQVSSVLFTKQ